MKLSKKIFRGIGAALILLMCITVIQLPTFAYGDEEKSATELWEEFQKKLDEQREQEYQRLKEYEEELRRQKAQEDEEYEKMLKESEIEEEEWEKEQAARDEQFKKDLEKQQAEWLKEWDDWAAEQDEYWKWYESLPYDEQMRLLKQDWEIHDMSGEQEKARKAAEEAKKAALPITLKVNGTVVKTDSPPVIENGRTLAPVRAIVEALGYLVAWDSTTKTIDVYNYYTEALVITMNVGSNKAKVAVGSGINSIMDERILDAPAKIINGRVMVPVRFIAESLGCTVSWDADTKTISITQAEG